MSPRYLAFLGLLGSAGLTACATKSDVQQLQTDVALFKAEVGRRDSARAAQLDEIIRLQRGMYDSLQAVSRAVGSIKGDLATDLYNIQQQLAQLQERAGQSQQSLSQLWTQLEARREQLQMAQVQADSGAVAVQPASSDKEIYGASVAQLRAGNAATARRGFRDMLQSFPSSELVPDALYFIGQTFNTESPDSARAYYQQVVSQYPGSPRAAAALFGLGTLAERAKDTAKAREYFRDVVEKYPKSYEADNARERLKAAPPR